MKIFTTTFLILLTALFFGCTGTSQEPVVLSVTDKEAEELAAQVHSEMSPTVADNFSVSLWASEKLLGDAIAIDVDDRGRVFVSVTERRRSSEFDIRGHSDWMIESIGLETAGDKKDFISANSLPLTVIKIAGLKI